MQPARFLYPIAAAAILGQAVPTLDRAPRSLTPNNGIDSSSSSSGAAVVSTILSSPAVSPDSVLEHGLAPRQTGTNLIPISRLAPLTTGMGMRLASGVALSVIKVVPTFFSFIPGVTTPIPTLPEVELALEKVAAHAERSPNHHSGILIKNLGFKAIEWAWQWDDGSAIIPNFTTIEWQTLIICLYRALPGAQWEEIRGHFNVGGRTLQIVLHLIRGSNL